MHSYSKDLPHPVNSSSCTKKFIAVWASAHDDIQTVVARTNAILGARHVSDIPMVEPRGGLTSLQHLVCRFKIKAQRCNAACKWAYCVMFASADRPYATTALCRVSFGNEFRLFEDVMKAKLTAMASGETEAFCLDSLKFHCYDRPTASENGFMELTDIFNLLTWRRELAPFRILEGSVPFVAAAPPLAAASVLYPRRGGQTTRASALGEGLSEGLCEKGEAAQQLVNMGVDLAAQGSQGSLAAAYAELHKTQSELEQSRAALTELGAKCEQLTAKRDRLTAMLR